MYVYAYAYLGSCVLHALGQPRELRALTYTHVAAHCATVARRHRYSDAMSPYVRTYAHMLYLGLRVLHALDHP